MGLASLRTVVKVASRQHSALGKGVCEAFEEWIDSCLGNCFGNGCEFQGGHTDF